MAWDVAAYRKLSDYEVGHKPASRLVIEYERVSRRQWEELSNQVLAAEQGVLRALAASFAGKAPKPFPTWDEVRRKSQNQDGTELSDFVLKFMAANAKKDEQRPPE